MEQMVNPEVEDTKMTTLAEGRAMMLAQYTPEHCPDPDFCKKGRAQTLAITTGDNPYYVWLNDLSHEERFLYGSVENHPDGAELCYQRWFREKCPEKWSKQYEESQQHELQQAA